MIHVLQIVPELNPSGGIENVIMNYYRAIDRTRFQFDFVTHSIVDDVYAKEAKSLGARICLMPKFTPQAFPRIEAKFAAVLRSQRYDVVHCNMANAAFLYLRMAKKAGIGERIRTVTRTTTPTSGPTRYATCCWWSWGSGMQTSAWLARKWPATSSSARSPIRSSRTPSIWTSTNSPKPRAAPSGRNWG